MAEKDRMTPEEVVSYLLEGDGVDYLRDSSRWMVEQLMEAVPCPRRLGGQP